jgi:hypothetical protein
VAKLTLRVDARVVSRAKHPVPHSTNAAPILRSLRGILKNTDIGEYRKHLAAKHR